MEYKRPEELRLLTEEEISDLYHADLAAEYKENSESNSDYCTDRYTRKWNKRIYNATEHWNEIRSINKSNFNELVYWLSVPDVPCNPHDTGLSKTKRLARDIKYIMTPKQRAIAYKVITERYNKNY